MNLRRYKELHPFRLEDFAKKIGVSITHASDLVNGKRQPALDVAVKIEGFTNNMVRCADLLTTPPSKKKSNARRAA